MPATHKEYLHCIHQNIQSTKPSPPQVEDAILNEAKTHLVYSVILDTTHKQGWGYYDSLSNFKGLQQLEDICGIKHPRVGDSNKPYHPISDVSPHRETKHHCNQLPLHQYPTRNKLLNTLHTTNYNYLLVYLMDAIDPTNHTKVSTAYINAIICPTTGRKQEFWHLIADLHTCHTWDNGMYDELGQLAEGNKLNNITLIQHIFFIKIPYPKIKKCHTSEV